jgi:hypothetical protein
MQERRIRQFELGAMMRRFVVVVLALASAWASASEVCGKAEEPMAQTSTVAAPEAQTQADSLAFPECADLFGGPAGGTIRAQSVPGVAFRTYVEDSVEELKRAVPALHGARFDEVSNAAESTTAAPSGDRTKSILVQASAVTAEMLHRIPNLIAREEVRQTIVPSGQRFLGTSARGQPTFAGESLNETQYHDRVYSYRIVPSGKAGIDDALDEFRTDNHDHPIANPQKDPDSPRSTGFATAWLFFIPGNLRESRFRYLGEQKVGNRETYVVAFAQIPGRTESTTVVTTPTGGCSTYSQGIAWIDESTYRIVRMQTDLLQPIANIELNQVRSVLNYGEVKIEKLNLTLWLPSDVETTWVSGNRAGDEVHKYSNYRLFASTVTILPPDQTPPQ